MPDINGLPTCPMCGGPLEPLGMIGKDLLWARCQDCHWIDPIEYVQEEEDQEGGDA